MTCVSKKVWFILGYLIRTKVENDEYGVQEIMSGEILKDRKQIINGKWRKSYSPWYIISSWG